MNFCKDCTAYERKRVVLCSVLVNGGGWRETDWIYEERCSRFAPRFDPVSGEPLVMLCREARKEGGKCGPEGGGFEAAP